MIVLQEENCSCWRIWERRGKKQKDKRLQRNLAEAEQTHSNSETEKITPSTKILSNAMKDMIVQ